MAMSFAPMAEFAEKAFWNIWISPVSVKKALKVPIVNTNRVRSPRVNSSVKTAAMHALDPKIIPQMRCTTNFGRPARIIAFVSVLQGTLD